MIEIKRSWIEELGEKSRAHFEVAVDGVSKDAWFEVDKEYEKYLCIERADAYVIGLLNLAMREGHDIVSQIPVTEELLYNIVEVLIPSLSNHSSVLKKISIQAPLAPAIKEGFAIGTGCSGGIDSFDSINSHYKSAYPEMDITHLCINDVGAFNECYSEYGIDKVKNERYEAAKKIADELGLPLIATGSNFAEAFPQNHLLTCTYSCCYAIYMLQKLWKQYYMASNGIDFSGFEIDNNDSIPSEHYDLLSLQCFSTEGIRIYDDGGAKTRLQKTKDLVDFDTAQKYLHVCVNKPYNCGKCLKCRRTLLSLDALNSLDKFGNVFNLAQYDKEKTEYYKELLWLHLKGDPMNEPVYKALCDRNDFKKIINSKKLYYSLKLKLKQFK